MSLRQHEIKGPIFHPILAVGYINFGLVLLMLVLSTTIFARPSGVQMEFPTYREGEPSAGQQVVIMVTSENVLYINDRVVTLNELRRFLAGSHDRALMIKADPRASMGRVADILELCRGIAGARVNVSTIL